jgi:hypothetical protein
VFARPINALLEEERFVDASLDDEDAYREDSGGAQEASSGADEA